jgi:hypothetical protein
MMCHGSVKNRVFRDLSIEKALIGITLGDGSYSPKPMWEIDGIRHSIGMHLTRSTRIPELKGKKTTNVSSLVQLSSIHSWPSHIRTIDCLGLSPLLDALIKGILVTTPILLVSSSQTSFRHSALQDSPLRNV